MLARARGHGSPVHFPPLAPPLQAPDLREYSNKQVAALVDLRLLYMGDKLEVIQQYALVPRTQSRTQPNI